MKRSDKYTLHIKIHLKKVSQAQTGKALGVIFRKHLTPGQVLCTTERMNNTQLSKKAETVIQKLLGRPSPWNRPAGRTPSDTQSVLLDDAKVRRLAQRWDSSGKAECMVVIPHIFYMPLLKRSVENIRLKAPEILNHVRIFFDYPIHENVPDIVKESFFGERAQVLNYARRMKFPFIDSGHQLFLENLISLACYMFPAKYLVFKDDDFFINSAASIETLLAPMRRGHLLAGKYQKGMDRIHSCFFALRPDSLRNELLLFDNGENLYAHAAIDTGTLLYRTLLNNGRGVFSLGDYSDGDTSLGRHLSHCGCELWYDLPQILKQYFRLEMLPKKGRRTKLDVSILMEALALFFNIRHQPCEYEPVDDEMRQKAWYDFTPYFSKIYNNYHWLMRRQA